MLLEFPDRTVKGLLEREPGAGHSRLLGIFKVPARNDAVALNRDFRHVISHLPNYVLIVWLHILKKILKCLHTVNLIKLLLW